MWFKFFWIIRAFFLKIFFGKIKMLSYIGRPIFLHNMRNVFIGKKVRIYPGLRCETYNSGKIIIKDDVGIGQNFHITCSTDDLIIEKGTTILGNVFITNIDHDYTVLNVPILKQDHIIKKTFIGENCFIGYGASIQAGTILGKQCIVGTNSVVRGVYPDYCVIAGIPAKIIKKYSFSTKKWEKV